MSVAFSNNSRKSESLPFGEEPLERTVDVELGEFGSRTLGGEGVLRSVPMREGYLPFGNHQAGLPGSFL
jgi:hypothetical protein